MRINHNISALNTFSRLTSANADKSKSLEKLSSGLRINKAGDDAAGLAISEKMRSQIKGLNQASRNAQDGISLIQTTEGALNETHSILQRMRELAVQSSNDTNTSQDRAELQKEMNQLTSEISRIGNDTEFNTKKVLNGNLTGSEATAVTEVQGVTNAVAAGDFTFTNAISVDGTDYGVVADVDALVTAINADSSSAYTASNSSGLVLTQKAGSGSATLPTILNTGSTPTATWATAGVAEVEAKDGQATLQIGANTSQSFSVDVGDMRSKALAISSETAGGAFMATGTANELDENSGATEYALDITDGALATAAIDTLDTAIETVSTQRSKLGAYQNRLEHTINNLNTASENLTAAESRVRDVDMAKEMMEFTKNNILSQASNAMMAQANQMPQSVLQLLQ